MKHLIILLAVLCISSGAFAQDSVTSPEGPTIEWDKPTVDFGDITQGDRVENTFRFTNAGTAPLIITNVEVTCGCTTPKGWPRDPIAPGGRGEITVAFNSTGKSGRQNKVIKVVSNSIGKENQVMFTANVLPKGEKKD